MYLIILSLFLTLSYSSSNKYRPPLPKQKRRTPTKQDEGVYNILKKIIIKEDEDKYNEDWYKNNKLKNSKVRDDIKDFGSEIKNIVKKHHFIVYGTPFNVQGIPILYPSKGTGVNLGVKLTLYNFMYRDPYKYSFSVQYWTSDRGRAKHRVKLDVPHFFNSSWRLILTGYYNYNFNSSYYGIGYDSNYDPELSNPYSSTYISRRYYNFKSREPGASIELRRRIFDQLSIFAGLDSRNNEISFIDNENEYFIKEESPYGLDGGILSYAKYGLLYETLNYPTNPETGNKIIFTISNFFSDYTFYGINFTWANFFTPSKYFTVASRFMAQQFYGDVPFFALSYFISDDVYNGLGGSDTIRGERGSRYINKFKIVEQIEIRINFYNKIISKQLIKIDLVPFVDFGTIANKFQNIDINNINYSFGSSFRLIWNKNFLVSFTYGQSPNNWTTYLSFGENF